MHHAITLDECYGVSLAIVYLNYLKVILEWVDISKIWSESVAAVEMSRSGNAVMQIKNIFSQQIEATRSVTPGCIIYSKLEFQSILLVRQARRFSRVEFYKS